MIKRADVLRAARKLFNYIPFGNIRNHISRLLAPRVGDVVQHGGVVAHLGACFRLRGGILLAHGA